MTDRTNDPMTDSPVDLLTRSEADAEVRDALHQLTAGLETPSVAWATAAAGQGRVLRRRRSVLRVVAPLAVAAVVAPLAWVGVASLDRPDDRRADRSRVAAQDQQDQSTDADATQDGTTPPAAVTPPSVASMPAVEDTRASVAPEEAADVLADLVAQQLGRTVEHTEVETFEFTDEVSPELKASLAKEVRPGISVADPDGASFVFATLLGAVSPSAQSDQEKREETEKCATSTATHEVTCTDVPEGRLELSTETDGELVTRTAQLVRADGSSVLVSSTNADGVTSLGGKVTRDEPLLTLEQLGVIARWDGWSS